MRDSLPRVSRHRTLFWAAIENALRYPLRLWVTVGCLVAVATPFLCGLAILEGVREEAAESVAAAGDILVTGYEHGRNASIPDSLSALAKRTPDVQDVRGRIVGRAYIDHTLVSIAGLEASRFAAVPRAGECWVGAGVARDLSLSEGSRIELSDVATVALKVSRVIPAESGLAAARLVALALTDAQTLYGTPGRLTDLAIWIRATERDRSQALLRVAFELRHSGIPLLIQTKKLMSDYVDRGFTLKGGTFLALYVVALGVLIPALLVTSGFGLSTRKREIGLMKALGFSILDILEMATDEVIVLALFSTLISFLLAYFWLKCARGFLIAAFFIAELEQGGVLQIPATFLPGPILVNFGLCLVHLSVGLVYTSYRVAVSQPLEALR